MLHRDHTYRTVALHLIDELVRVEERLRASVALHALVHELADVTEEECPVDASVELAIRATVEARRQCRNVVEMQVGELRTISDVAREWRAFEDLDDVEV